INFSHADMSFIEFDTTTLKNINFSRTNLYRTDFTNAIIDLETVNFNKALTLYKAKFDEPLKSELESKYPHLFKKPHWLIEEKEPSGELEISDDE
ncbi:MAG: pentapeptide repeat-containing protein, partial [Saprospiraceae bacterium]